MEREIEVGPDPLGQGLELFNSGHFFEAHDVWEDHWTGVRGRDRPFFEGLIHAAVGCYHLNNRNFRGARSQLEHCREALAPFSPSHLGVDVESTLSMVSGFLNRLADLEAPDLADLPRPSIRREGS